MFVGKAGAIFVCFLNFFSLLFIFSCEKGEQKQCLLMYEWSCEKNKTRERWNHKDGGEETQDHPTSVQLATVSSAWNRCRVMFLRLFSTIFVVSPLPCFCLFYSSIPTWVDTVFCSLISSRKSIKVRKVNEERCLPCQTNVQASWARQNQKGTQGV